MLEHPVLLVRPGGKARRAIVAPDTGAPLGFARWRTGAAGRWWPYGRPALAVHEHEDEPLLFTVQRCWTLLPRREVCDAEGRTVGTLLGRRLWDRFGRGLAVLHPEAGRRAVFHGPDGRSLGQVSAGEDGLRVSFGPEVEGDPFAKMLLLAAALSEAAG